ncbi:MAG TPA: hypothetical protein VL241_03030 [Gemmatimonadales bacterium]|nr:hypothetical protein [Gemmatimonadales bacterium]
MRRFCLPPVVPLLALLARPAPLPGQQSPRAAVQRDSARIDSLRRRMEARSESIVRARRQAAAGMKPARSPLSGQSPFYGYTWVFYADLLAGVLAGLVAVQLRHRGDSSGVRLAWSVVGVLLGAGSAVAVFLPLFLFNAMFSIGFSAMPPALLFGLSLSLILIAAVSLAVSPRKG